MGELFRTIEEMNLLLALCYTKLAQLKPLLYTVGIIICIIIILKKNRNQKNDKQYNDEEDKP